MKLTVKEELLLDIINGLRAAEHGMRVDHDKYQKIFYELIELSKMVRDGYAIGIARNECAVIRHVDSEVTRLSQLCVDFF